MAEEHKESEETSGPTPKGPAFVYSSPFAAQAAGEPPPAAAPPAAEATTAVTPPAAAPGSGGPSGGRLVLVGAALAVVVMAASAAGALIAHEFWTPAASPSAASSGAPTTPSTPSVGGFPGAGTGSFGGNGSSSGSSSNGSNGNGGFQIAPGITVGPNGISFGNGNGGSNGNGSSGTGGPQNGTSIAAKVNPALVDVNVSYSYQGGEGAGTGIVLSSNGEVVTNNHVIDGATHITATDIGNGKTYEAKVVGYDPSHDVAVLQLQSASGLATANLGDSSKLKVGDPVLGIGNAGGAGGTPSSAGGQITALGQTITAGDEFGGKSEQLSGLLETNAGIAAGDSGGPLVDGQGRVIGMNTAGSAGFGFGYGQSFGGAATRAYAIPISQVLATVGQIKAGQGSSTVHIGASAFLGVQVASSNGGFGGFFGGYGNGSSVSGVSVGGVVSGGPASKIGLGAGDTITGLDGQAISTSTELSRVMLGHHPGDKVTVWWTTASGQRHSASVQLATGPPS
jgi:S1-C subfamily serine protease